MDMEQLAKHVNDHPNAYLQERAQVFGVTFQAIHCALKRLGIRYKKNTTTSKSQRTSAYSVERKSRRL